MKNKPHSQSSKFYTILLCLFSLQFCAQPPAKDGDVEVTVKDADTAAPASENKQPRSNVQALGSYCDNYKTSQRHAKNVIPGWGFDDEFDLYWIGNSNTAISFWTNDGKNRRFNITRAPLTVYMPEKRDGSRILCLQSRQAALDCIDDFDLILYEMGRFREKVEEGKASLDLEKIKTFHCVEKFILDQIQYLSKETLR